MKTPQLTRGAFFTDLHVGAKSNSQQHNEDCLDYIEWFCAKVKADPLIDHIIFAGDWYEVRSAINVFTLDYSYKIASKINDLGLPVFFIIGNHDLYYRNKRDVYSTVTFNEFSNFTVVDEPVVLDNIGKGVLLCPFLFHDEYHILTKYSKVPFWVGHFEFKGFIVTGYNITMKTGPEHTDFSRPKHIISGHFHKRQQSGNVTYIGNTFPTNFSDAGDSKRGMMVYDHNTDEMAFFDWENCPQYIKANLSEILEGNVEMFPKARVKCIADIPITYEEHLEIKKKFIETHNLREFNIEESVEISEALTDTDEETVVTVAKIGTVDEMVVTMLDGIKSDHIDNELLTSIYKEL